MIDRQLLPVHKTRIFFIDTFFSEHIIIFMYVRSTASPRRLLIENMLQITTQRLFQYRNDHVQGPGKQNFRFVLAKPNGWPQTEFSLV